MHRPDNAKDVAGAPAEASTKADTPRPGRVANLRRLNADPTFAAARDDNARAVLADRGADMRRKSALTRRGCDVPPHLIGQWKELKAAGISNREAARMLGLAWSANPKEAANAAAIVTTGQKLMEGTIDLPDARAALVQLLGLRPVKLKVAKPKVARPRPKPPCGDLCTRVGCPKRIITRPRRVPG